MKRTATILRTLLVLTLCVVCKASPSSGGTNTLLQEETSVSVATDTALVTSPGKILTATFRITNRADIGQRYQAQIRLPAGWKSLTKEAPFSVAPGGTEIRLATFSVPRQTPSGEYEIEYRVFDTTLTYAAVEAIAQIAVRPVRQLTLKLINAPRFVTAGSSYQVVYVLSSTGNVEGLVGLQAWNANGLPVAIDSAVLRIKPGSADTVRVTVRTDPGQIRTFKQMAHLRASMLEDSTVFASLPSGVDVIPVIREDRSMYHWYPGHAMLRMAGTDGVGGAQAEFSGMGSLDEYGEHRLAFFARGPDVQQYSMLGHRDEYYLMTGTDRYQAMIGDRNYALSPLTEYGRYAFGGGGSVNVGRFSIGGFYNTTRFASPRTRERAGFVHYQVDPSALFSLSYLGKEQFGKTDIISLRTQVKPFTNSEVDLEYAAGFTGGETDYASSIRFSGRERWIYYDLRFIHADPGYRGYFRNVDYMSGNVILYPWRELRLEAMVREEERNINKDPSLYSAPQNRFYRFGAGWGNYITVLYRTESFEDLMPGALYSRKERAIEIRSSLALQHLSYLARVEIGTNEEQPLGRRTPFRRYSLFGNIMPSHWHSYGISFEYHQDENLLTGEPVDRLTGGLTARATFWGKTRVFVNVQNSQTVRGPKQSYSFIDFGIEHRLHFGHLLTFQGRRSHYTPSYNGNDLAYMLQYVIPFSVPLGRTSASGTLSGRVIDTETGLGVADVLLYAGSAVALSDGTGEFGFPSIPPGVHEFQVDLASLGRERVLASRLPDRVAIHGAEEARIDVKTVKGASVSGAIVRYDFQTPPGIDDSNTSMVARGGLAGFLLELSDGSVHHRRFTGTHGRFDFSGIVPGRWTLKVLSGNVPSDHYFERDFFVLDIVSGSRGEVLYRVLPSKRTIKLLEQSDMPKEPVEN
ncbi:MAG: carboxypeptidase-like regulatory domain-containing protein [Bacteroidota bacterium]